MQTVPSPRTLRASVTMRRIRQADASARQLAERRANMRKHGCTGPITRAELAARATR